MGLLSVCTLQMNAKTVLIGTVALALAGGVLLSNRYSRRIHFLEKETQNLAAQISESSAARPNAEESAVMLTRRLEAQSAELAKLRGRITDSNALRAHPAHHEPEQKGLDRSEAEKNKITEHGAANVSEIHRTVISAAAWQDVGGTTAQNALQTFLWSLRTRNADRLIQFVDPADHELLVKDGEVIATELAKVTGYSLLDTVQISPDQQVLRLRLDEENGETKTEEFHFINLRGQWHFSENAKLSHLKAVEKAKR